MEEQYAESRFVGDSQEETSPLHNVESEQENEISPENVNMEEQNAESRFVGDSQEEILPLHIVESEQGDEISPEVSNEGNNKPSAIKLLKNVNMEEQNAESRFVGDSQEETSPLHNVESEQENEISPEVSNEGNNKPSTSKLPTNVSMEEQYAESRFVGDSQEEILPLHNVESEQGDEISPEVSNEGNNKPSTSKLPTNVNMEEQYAESRFVGDSQEEISPLHNLESEQGNEISLEVGNEGNSKPSAIKRLKNAFFERKEKEFTNFTLIMTPVSMFSYGFDVGSDLLNAYSYYINRNNIENNMTYFVLTLVCTVVPSLLMHSFSLWRAWESLRKHRSQNTRKNNLHFIVFILTHILQVGLIYRFVRSIYFGRKLQKGKDEYYHKKWIKEDTNIVAMRSIEVYFEAIPQLMLQIYIMLTTGQAPIITVLACFGSVGGLSMAIRSFGVSMNGADYEDISPAETICFLLYQACTLLSRVLAFALLLNLNVWAGIGLLLLHWILATLFFYITVDGVDDGCTGILTRIIFGFIFIFNVPVGFLYDIAPLRWIEIAYFAENSLIAGVWLKITDSNYYFSIPSFYIAIAIVVSIPALFILSFFFVLCLHLMDKRHKKLNQG